MKLFWPWVSEMPLRPLFVARQLLMRTLLAAVERAGPSLRLMAAATAQRERLGAPIPPQEQLQRERALSTAHAAIPPSGFERAWSDGGQLSILEAVELAAESLTQFVESRSL